MCEMNTISLISGRSIVEEKLKIDRIKANQKIIESWRKKRNLPYKTNINQIIYDSNEMIHISFESWRKKRNLPYKTNINQIIYDSNDMIPYESFAAVGELLMYQSENVFEK